MNLRATGQLFTVDAAPGAVYGQPYETVDGATIIPVLNPVGVFVVKDGAAVWRPAVDATRITLMGIAVGLVSVTLAGLAMVRRPPWPDLHGDVSTHVPAVSLLARRVRPGP